jgi:flagellar basal body rod protein FlgC
MNLFDSLAISGSALLAERQRSEVIAANMANARPHTPRPAAHFGAGKLSSRRVALPLSG